MLGCYRELYTYNLGMSFVCNIGNVEIYKNTEEIVWYTLYAETHKNKKKTK